MTVIRNHMNYNYIPKGMNDFEKHSRFDGCQESVVRLFSKNDGVAKYNNLSIYEMISYNKNQKTLKDII